MRWQIRLRPRLVERQPPTGDHRKTQIAVILGIIVFVVICVWFWGVLVGYVDPGTKGASDRKDVVQTFALIAAGVVAAIGGIVGILNLQISRRNQRLQIELEDQRSQDAALQAYFEHMGDLLTTHDLINTDREDIRQLAQAQTLTVVERLDQNHYEVARRKGQLLVFLSGAGLINKDKTIVNMSGVDLWRAFLVGDNLSGTNLSGADLSFAELPHADFSGANLSGTVLTGADLSGADLSGADLSGATVTEEQLTTCKSLTGATMPDNQKFEDWRKTRPHFKHFIHPSA